jgi:hypothetical protein
MDIPTEIVVAVIGLAGLLGVPLLKIMRDQSRSLEIQRTDAERSARIGELRIQREIAMDARAQAYDEYDKASKELTLAHANSYLVGNDKAKLGAVIKDAEAAKKRFSEANKEYYSSISTITDQMMGKAS